MFVVDALYTIARQFEQTRLSSRLNDESRWHTSSILFINENVIYHQDQKPTDLLLLVEEIDGQGE